MYISIITSMIVPNSNFGMWTQDVVVLLSLVQILIVQRTSAFNYTQLLKTQTVCRRCEMKFSGLVLIPLIHIITPAERRKSGENELLMLTWCHSSSQLVFQRQVWCGLSSRGVSDAWLSFNTPGRQSRPHSPSIVLSFFFFTFCELLISINKGLLTD